MIRGTDVLQNEPKEEKMRCLGNESWWKTILYCMSFLLIFFVSLFAHYVIKKPLSFFLIRKPTKEILKWISIGFVLPLSVISIYLIFGKIELIDLADLLSLSKITYFVVSTISMALLGGIIEEILFRGYMFRILEEKWNPAIAILVLLLYTVSKNFRDTLNEEI